MIGTKLLLLTILRQWVSLVAQLVKNPPAMQETWIRSLGLEDPLLLLLSHFSRVRRCATPETAAHQVPRPWDSPGKKTRVGCHFLLQCMTVKSESEVA